MPENKVLDKVKHQKEKYTEQKKIKYYVSTILRDWEPDKAKLTKIVLEAKFNCDIKRDAKTDKDGIHR